MTRRRRRRRSLLDRCWMNSGVPDPDPRGDRALLWLGRRVPSRGRWLRHVVDCRRLDRAGRDRARAVEALRAGASKPPAGPGVEVDHRAAVDRLLAVHTVSPVPWSAWSPSLDKVTVMGP